MQVSGQESLPTKMRHGMIIKVLRISLNTHLRMMEIGGCFSQILLLTSIKYIFAKYSQQPGPSTLFTANGPETPQVGLTR